MSMQNMIFRCDFNEKNRFMVEAENLGLDASFLLRRFVHLFLTDKNVRQAILTLEKNYKEDF